MKCATCNAELTEWQQAEEHGYNTGPPELPRQGARGSSQNYNEWFVFRSGPGDHAPWYVAYCPEHKGPAVAWKQELIAWQNQRSGQGKKVYLSWIDRLKALVGIGIPGPQARKETAKAMGIWVAGNPKPRPPWQKV